MLRPIIEALCFQKDMSEKHTKVRHYSQIGTSYASRLDSETILLELFVTFLAGVFAYMGYRGGILFLFLLCSVVALMAFISALLHIYSYLTSRQSKSNE